MSSATTYDPTAPGYAEQSSNGTQLRSSISSARASIDENLRTRVEQNPWGVIGIAVAAGYVAGGGLFTPLTAKLLGLGVRLGLRLALVPMVRQEIASIAGSVRQGVAS